MKFGAKYIGFMACVAAVAVLSGCTTNAETGAVELFGVIPVDSAVDVADAAAGTAAKSGGVVGLIGVAAGALIGIWRRSKEKNAIKTAQAVVDGTSAVLGKIDEANANGGLTFSREDAVELLKNIQEDAGVRDAVKKILEKEKA